MSGSCRPWQQSLQLAGLVILLGVGHAEAGVGRVGADPAQISVDACVDSRRMGPGTALAPRDNSGQLILSGLLVEEHVQRTAAVASAGILGGVTGAEHVLGDQRRSVATFAAFPLAEHKHLHLLGGVRGTGIRQEQMQIKLESIHSSCSKNVMNGLR